MSDITHILESIQRGDRRAAEELLPLVDEELRRSFSCTTRRLPQAGVAGTMRA